MRFNSLTIKEAHRGLVEKQFSCAELTRDCLETIKEKEPKLNAFITVTENEALEAAEKIDQKIKDGDKLGILTGIPCAIKDNILVEGVKSTAGSKMLANYVAPYDATVVSKLKKLDSIILGKTNMDEFAMGSSGETSYFGPTKNPIDLERVPGGSSSGSGAAVCADETIFALGTDTGGSVRHPASLLGVVGFKPTYGRISRHGVIAMASSFDQVGCITKSVEDAAIVFESLAGKDQFDSTTVDLKANVLKNLEKSLKGKKIGLPKEYFVSGMDPKVESVIKKGIAKFTDLGAEVVEMSLPRAKYALSIYYILMPAEVSSNLARFDGVRFGHRADSENLLEMYLKTRREGFGDEVRRRIMLGTYVLSSGYYDAYYKRAQQVRRLIKEDYDRAFESVDCIVTPTSPTTAFKIGEKFDDPMTMYLADIFTVSVNVAGLPAISIPCGKVNNLPVGIQLITKHYDEASLFNFANELEKALK